MSTDSATTAVTPVLAKVMEVALPDAGFYLWARIPDALDISDTEYAKRLYAEYNVTVLPGSYLAREAHGDNPGRNRLRMALVAEVDERVELTDAMVVAIVEKMIKQRKDSITQFEAGGRQDLADKEKAELAILSAYMPAAMSEAEIAAEVAAAVTQVNPTGPQDMGKVMAVVKAKLAGRADMTVVSGLVKAALTK